MRQGIKICIMQPLTMVEGAILYFPYLIKIYAGVFFNYE